MRLKKVLSVSVLFIFMYFLSNSSVLAYNSSSATKEYNNALKNYNYAASVLYKAQSKYPKFSLTGEIQWRNSSQLQLWGQAMSATASPSHPGWVPDYGNILVKNYNVNSISYKNYYGYGYYIKTATGTGYFGQDVPVYVFGSAPYELRLAESNFNSAEARLYRAKAKLPVKFNVRIKGINVTDNFKKPLKLETLPIELDINYVSEGSQQVTWYYSSDKKSWKRFSTKKFPSFELTREKIYLKVVSNNDRGNYSIHSVSVTLPATGFKDIPRTHWAAESIRKLTKAGIMKGVSGGNFNPNGTITRGEFAKLLVDTYSLPTSNPESPSFTDVEKSNIYYKYIEATKVYFYPQIDDFKNLNFSPSKTIIKSEAISILMNLGLIEDSNLNGATYLQNNFKDSNTVNAIFKQNVAVALSKNIFHRGNSNKFEGSSSLKRVDAAYFLYTVRQKYYQKAIINEQISLPALVYYDSVSLNVTLNGKSKLFVNGKLIQKSGNKYSKNFTFPNGEGTYSFKLKIRVPFGYKDIVKEVKYFIPLPDLIVNEVDSMASSEEFVMSGTLTDKTDEFPTLYINGKEVYVSQYEDGEWSEDYTLVEGVNTFTIKAVNASGKTTIITKTITYTPPVPKLIVNEIPTTTASESLRISGSVTDSNDSDPQLFINNVELYVSTYSGGTWSEDYTLEEGENTFTIKAVNKAGKTTIVTKTITYSPPAPKLIVNEIPTTTGSESLRISGSVTDSNDRDPQIFINNVETYVSTYSGGTWSEDYTLEEGENTFTIKAVNKAGKTTIVTKTITYTPPTPKLTVNDVVSNTENESLRISGKVTDSNDKSPRVFINGIEVYVSTYNGGTWYEDFTLVEGENTFTIKAENKAGKTSIITKIITYTPPAPKLTVYDVVSNTESESLRISGKVTDSNDEYPRLYINGIEVYVSSYNGGTWYEDFTLVEGENTFTIKAENKAGKITIITKTITYTPPAPKLTVNDVASNTNSESLRISGKVTDSNDEYPRLYINGIEVYVSSYNGGTWYEDFTLEVGENIFTIKAENKAGKTTIITKSITYTP